MARQNPVGQASFEEYLELEAHTQERHEYVDGYLFAMAGGIASHKRLISRQNRLIFDSAEASGCELFMAAVILQTPAGGVIPDSVVRRRMAAPPRQGGAADRSYPRTEGDSAPWKGDACFADRPGGVCSRIPKDGL